MASSDQSGPLSGIVRWEDDHTGNVHFNVTITERDLIEWPRERVDRLENGMRKISEAVRWSEGDQ